MNAAVSLETPYRLKLTIDEFVLLDRTEAFQDYGKTELIDGQIIVMNAQYSPHFKVKNRLYRLMADACDALDRGVEAWSEGAIGIPPHNVPEPDVFVTSRTPMEPFVVIDTVLLIVEVASTTLRNDLGRKARLYAAAGIPEYWVADVNGRVIHQLWAAKGKRYAQRRETAFGERIEAVTIPALGIATVGL